MTVQELIAKLMELPQNMEVRVPGVEGGGYEGARWSDVTVYEGKDDEGNDVVFVEGFEKEDLPTDF